MSKSIRINLRLSGEEAERFSKVWELVLQRTLGEAKLTNVVKELLGLRPQRLVTAQERAYLMGKGELPEGDDLPRPTVRPRITVSHK